MQCLRAEYSCPKKRRTELNGSTSQPLRKELKKGWNSRSVLRSMGEVLNEAMGLKKER